MQGIKLSVGDKKLMIVISIIILSCLLVFSINNEYNLVRFFTTDASNTEVWWAGQWDSQIPIGSPCNTKWEFWYEGIPGVDGYGLEIKKTWYVGDEFTFRYMAPTNEDVTIKCTDPDFPFNVTYSNHISGNWFYVETGQYFVIADEHMVFRMYNESGDSVERESVKVLPSGAKSMGDESPPLQEAEFYVRITEPYHDVGDRVIYEKVVTDTREWRVEEGGFVTVNFPEHTFWREGPWYILCRWTSIEPYHKTLSTWGSYFHVYTPVAKPDISIDVNNWVIVGSGSALAFIGAAIIIFRKIIFKV